MLELIWTYNWHLTQPPLRTQNLTQTQSKLCRVKHDVLVHSQMGMKGQQVASRPATNPKDTRKSKLKHSAAFQSDVATYRILAAQVYPLLPLAPRFPLSPALCIG